MKKILSSMLIVIISLSFMGCAKVVNTESKGIKATIVNTNYSSGDTYTTYIKTDCSAHMNMAGS